jgi:hypothetical protein
MFTPTDERIFELEMWIKGVAAFFQVEHLPLSAYEKEHASLYNFRSELGCVRTALAKIQGSLNEMLGPDRAHLGSFMLYLQGLQPGSELTKESLHGDLLTALERIQDLERIVAEEQNISFISLQTYLANGRIIQAFLKDYLAINRLFQGEAKPGWGAVQKAQIREHLRLIKKHPAGKDLLTLIIAHIKALRYLEIIGSTIEDRNSYPAAVVIFALLHHHLQKIGQFIGQRLIPKLKGEAAYAVCLDSLLFSSMMEMRKVMEIELVDVTVLLDPKSVRIKVEDSIGILRDLFQQNLVYILETFSLKELDGSRLFPYYQTRREQTLVLLEDLKGLDKTLQEFREKGSRADYQHFLDALLAFQGRSMRFLMYKDWAPIERFIGDFKNSASMKQREILAHQFGVFLKTLIGFVAKRAVLTP